MMHAVVVVAGATHKLENTRFKTVKQLVGAGVGAGGMAGLQPAAGGRAAKILKLLPRATIRSYYDILDRRRSR
jgi:hypothetical protein